MLKDLVTANRSCRRFQQDAAVDLHTLKELVDLGRLSASGHNMQALKYILSASPEKNARIFPLINMGKGGQPEGDRPSAYIIILGDKRITQNFGVNHGVAAQSITLGAVEKGLAACMIGMVKKEQMRNEFEIPEHFEILLAIALGKAKETRVIEKLGPDGSVTAYYDDKGVRHVPKRELEDIIIG
ncbi:MAG: nitroreductase family protein [Chloroflexi bacterium]|nr:nitroreductase family protein [Chloroflexota bacterium]